MHLSSLLRGFVPVMPEWDRSILHLTLDSRQVSQGSLFLAVKGTHVDGREYIESAIKKGAAAICVDADAHNSTVSFQSSVPIIPIAHLSAKAGEIAARFYDYPAKKMRMIGVTGTNGKTSCTHFIAQSLQALNIPCGVIGTLGSGLYGALGEAGLTTPDPVTLQATLQALYQQGAKAIAMEVSSHSIHQERISGIAFEIGIFTNLTQDHLDYHGDMATYAAVKRRFFTDYQVEQAVINADDTYGLAWITELCQKRPLLAYTVREAIVPDDVPLVRVNQTVLSLQGIKAQVASPWGTGELTLPLMGEFNLSNALAVLSALCLYGIPLEKALSVLAHLTSVPGRMQVLGGQGKPLVIVDYAHTPDALEKVLMALRKHTQGQLICVFGCGGDRDTGKRPIMAKIAEKWADKVIVTTDNPRHEKPEAIAAHIMQGFADPKRVVTLLDRSKAIENSIQYALAEDCVLIAGKGAERYQQIADERIPFDDVEKVKAYL